MKNLCFSSGGGWDPFARQGNFIVPKAHYQCEALYIINSEGIAYHQNAVLYIIIAKAYAPAVMRYNNGNAVVDDIQPDG